MDSAHEQGGGGVGGGSGPPSSKRRVSISEQAFGLDNPCFEHSRRISASSEHNSEPGRKRSILHYGNGNFGSIENIQQQQQHKFEVAEQQGIRINGNNRKKSAMSLSSSLRDKIEYSEELKRYTQREGWRLESGAGKKDAPNEPALSRRLSDSWVSVDRSWLYVFCSRCHGREEASATSWEPPGWRRACPRPFCPSYRKFARVSCLSLLGTMTWAIVYSIIGEDAAPGGPLFGLAALSIAAHFGGWLFSLTTLPALIGMLVTGILAQNLGLVDIGAGGSYSTVIANLRKIALVIILTRAGLDLDPKALKKQRITLPKLGLIPWCVEATVIGVTATYLLGLPWMWSFLIGSVVAAVSPAVVVPCLFRLRGKGYGVAKGIPTLIIAIAGIDDAASVAIFGIIKSVMFSKDALWYQILQGPIAIIGGIGFGVLWGCLARYVPEKGDPFAVPMRVLMLLVGGLLAVFGSEAIELGGAGPLAVVAAAFVSSYFWQKEGWEIDDNPVAISFEIFWMIFEPILFGVTGAQIRIEDLEGSTIYLTIGCLLAGIIVRIGVTVLVGIGSRFNLKEKIFIAFACMAKATVQAALGPVTLDEVDPSEPEEVRHAERMLTFCVVSILLTAPAGGIIISLAGPKLLTKTSEPVHPPEGWRSRKPSIRDISIINEDPDLEESAAAAAVVTASSVVLDEKN